MDRFLTGGSRGAPPLPSSKRRKSEVPSDAKRKRPHSSTPLTQTYIDVGQKSFARLIECPVCKFTYTHGEEEDEAAHRRHHRRVLQGIRVRGTLASLRPLGERSDQTQLIALDATHGPDARRKVAEVVALFDAEPGAKPVPDEFRAFLCLEPVSSRVRAFVIAEPVRCAHWTVPTPDCAEEEDNVPARDGVSHDVLCGISHIWVDPDHRHSDIAAAMLDTVRRHYAAGFEVSREQLAFSSPTPNVRALAEEYMGSGCFLVYDI